MSILSIPRTDAHGCTNKVDYRNAVRRGNQKVVEMSGTSQRPYNNTWMIQAIHGTTLEQRGCPCPRAELLVRALMESNSALARHAKSLYAQLLALRCASLGAWRCILLGQRAIFGERPPKPPKIMFELHRSPFAHDLQTIGKNLYYLIITCMHIYIYIYTL